MVNRCGTITANNLASNLGCFSSDSYKSVYHLVLVLILKILIFLKEQYLLEINNNIVMNSANGASVTSVTSINLGRFYN